MMPFPEGVPLASVCPACGKEHDQASNPVPGGSRLPEPGDLNVCFTCETILVFDQVMAGAATLRVLTPEEVDALDPEVLFDLSQAQATIRAAKRPVELPRPARRAHVIIGRFTDGTDA